MKSTQGVYPTIQDDDTAFAFVEFIHSRGSAILLAKEGPGAPRVYVSLMYGRREEPHRKDRLDGIHLSPGCLGSSTWDSRTFLP